MDRNQRLVLTDATTNEIKIVRNQEYCLVYQRPIPDSGLSWNALLDWWLNQGQNGLLSREDAQKSLYRRLKASLQGNGAEEHLFRTYYERFVPILDEGLPALIPQVYLHYDPYTWRNAEDAKYLVRQRMDFLLLLPHRHHIVIEIDGKQHYADSDRASPSRYAQMVSEDRRLKLTGYEVYRFGGQEFVNKDSASEIISGFFDTLFRRHKLIV